MICLAGAIPSLAIAQFDLEKMRALNPQMQLPLTIVEDQVLAEGIATCQGQFLTLYYDTRDEAQCRELVAAFDQAVPQWCRIFQVNPAKTKPWRLVGFLIADRPRFERAGLWPPDLPEFPAGYNRGHHFWIYPQPGNYYTRHLLLHEGTHAFMQWFLGGSGPPWYSEGMAEWIALHRWEAGELQLQFRVSSRDEVEYWGRPKLIRKALEADRRWRLDQVLDFNSTAFLEVEHYAWAWAACEFLSSHPASADEFAALRKSASDYSSRFSQRFKQSLTKVWPQLEFDWLQYVEELDYGITAARFAVRPLELRSAEQGFECELAADWGWQSTGLSLQPGECWEISASGRFQIQAEPEIWPCEAGGITIDYYRSRPLGELLAAILPDSPQSDQPLQPIPVGRRQLLQAEQPGTLLLRINEAPGRLEDNQGRLSIRILKQ